MPLFSKKRSYFVLYSSLKHAASWLNKFSNYNYKPPQIEVVNRFFIKVGLQLLAPALLLASIATLWYTSEMGLLPEYFSGNMSTLPEGGYKGMTMITPEVLYPAASFLGWWQCLCIVVFEGLTIGQVKLGLVHL